MGGDGGYSDEGDGDGDGDGDSQCKFDGEIFFYFNTGKVFRLGDILALRWHFCLPLVF